ncbi:MAG: hypothetical protein P9M03_11460 [Candidatus Theseobacter exili]|nr:hypothetical protein [Candidatus Theseobacter exili]
MFSVKSRRAKGMLRTVSLFVCLNLVFFQLSGFSLPIKYHSGNQAASSLPDLKIPSHLGLVKAVSKGASDKFVICLEDIHCDYSAQKNLVQIMRLIHDTVPFTVIGLEGASGIVDPTALAVIQKKNIRNAILDRFLKSGELTAAETFAASGIEGVRLTGIETPALYRENRSQFLTLFKQQNIYLDALGRIDNVLSKRMEEIFPGNVLELGILSEKLDKQKISIGQFLKELVSQADETASINLHSYNEVREFIKARELSASIDTKLAAEQAESLVRNLQNVLGENEIRKLLRLSLAFRIQKIAAADYYKELTRYARQSTTSVQDFDQLVSYVELADIFDRIDLDKLRSQTQDILLETREAYLETPSQKKLEKAYWYLDVVKKLFSLKASRHDVNLLNSEFKDMSLISVCELLEIDSEDFSDLDMFKDRSLEFYKTAKERDKALADNLLESMNRTKADKAVLVAGGFHTRGILEHLKKSNISYAVIMPKTNTNSEVLKDKDIYINVLSNDKTPLEEFLTQKNTLAPEVRSAFKGLVEEDLRYILEEKAMLLYTILEAWESRSFEDVAMQVAIAQKQLPGLYYERLLERFEMENIPTADAGRMAREGKSLFSEFLKRLIISRVSSEGNRALAIQIALPGGTVYFYVAFADEKLPPEVS